MVSRYRMNAVGSMIDNGDGLKRQQLFQALGIAFCAYGILTTDAEGEEFQELYEAVRQAKNAPRNERGFEYINVKNKFDRYMSAVTGGWVEEYSTMANIYINRELVKKLAVPWEN